MHKTKRTITLLLTALLSLVLPNELHAQQAKQPEGTRPKIGLVLSGGGAKGLAHIGILKAIDRAGLHIDYITGTSMGAIVAAMYASGYNGQQIEQEARDMKWMDLISSKPNYQDISIEEKDEFSQYVMTFPMDGLKFMPWTGVFEPYQVMLKLKEVFFPVYKISDFSKLDIPFKCIAADLGSGYAVTLDHGDLAFATRSSMAIPGVFAATDYNGTKLVDGGIVRNFPVKDVVEMGADYVIGVNLFSGLTPANEMTTPLDVMMQAINFRDAHDLEEEKAICDMVIEPDVSNYNAASFAAMDTILAIGDSTGAAFEPLFRQLADSLRARYGLQLATPDRLKPYDSQVRIKNFQVEGLKATSESQLLHHLNLHQGHLYTPHDFTEAIKSAMSSGYYGDITYELIPEDEVGNMVTFKCMVKENPIAALKVALSYNTFTSASLILDYQRKNILNTRSTTDLKIAVSKDFRVRLNNHTLIGQRGTHYFDAKYEATLFYLPLYGESRTRQENLYKYSQQDISATIGHTFSLSDDLRLRLGWQHFRLKPDVAGDKELYGRVFNFYATLNRRVNTLDRKYLPTKGHKYDFEFYSAVRPQFKFRHGQMADSLSEEFKERPSTFRLSARMEMHQALSKRLSLAETVAAVGTYGDRVFVHRTALGGCESFLPSHFNFYGLTTARQFESSMLMARLSAQYRILGDFYGQFHLNSAVVFRDIEDCIENMRSFLPTKFIHGGGITVAYDLGFLPIDITLMYSPDDKFNVNVNVGFLF